ncbi:hypothetical protein ACFL0N_01540 [Pseudomonadota bacterium]
MKSERKPRLMKQRAREVSLNPAWIAFIRHCQQLGHGEISVLKIQDGVPVMAEESTRKIKFI